MRLIDADKIVYSWQIDADGNEHDGVTLQSIIDDMPTIEERKRGKWELQTDHHEKHYGWYICSECGAWIGTPANFCSECGADMRGES